MKIGIDMDDTICSTKESIIKYQNIFIKDKNISSDELWNNNTYKDEFLNKYLSDIYTNAKVKENCIKILNQLSKDNELYIITARTTNYIDDIIKLTKNYLANNNIKVKDIFINSKDKVDTCIKNNIDLMIDDNYYNYQALTNNNINTILFDELDRYKHINNKRNNWNKLIDILKWD